MRRSGDLADLHQVILRGDLPKDVENWLVPDLKSQRMEWELSAAYRRAWLKLYRCCREFHDALREFYSRYYQPARSHFYQTEYGAPDRQLFFSEVSETALLWGVEHGEDVPPPRSLMRYIEQMALFCRAHGLDRLSQGAEEVHWWCENAARYGGEFFYVPRDVSVGFLPSLGDAKEYILPLPDGGQVRVRDATSDPVLKVNLRRAWRFHEVSASEMQAQLEAEAGKQIREQIAAINARAKALGAIFPDTKPKLALHLAWIFERVKYQFDFPTIAGHTQVPYSDSGHRGWEQPLVQTVKTAVHNLAPKIGLDIAGIQR